MSIEFEVGIKITGKDGGGSAAISAVGTAAAQTEKKISGMGQAAKRTRVQMDALSAGMSSVGKRQWEGIQMANKMASASTRLLIEQQKALQKQLATNTAGWAALGEMGAKQMRGIEMANKMAASSTSLVIEKQRALEIQLAKNTTGWAKLGGMGAKQMRGIEIANKMASASIVSESNKTAKAVDKVGKASEKAGLSFRGWLPHIRTTGAAIGVYLGVRTIGNIVKAADAYTNMSARLRLVASDARQLANIQSRLFQISQSNQSGLEETTRLYTRMAMGLKDLGRSQAEILNVTDLLGKGMKISGASTVEASAGLLQFAQAMQSGILAGDEFRSMMENMPRISKAIADGLGVSLGQLRKMSAAQELTSVKAIKALTSQSDALNREAARIPVTLGRAWTELSNAFTKLIGDADQALGVTKSIAAGIEAMAKAVAKFAKTQSPLEETREQIRLLAVEIQNLRNPGVFTFFAEDRLKTALEQMRWLETRKNRLMRESQSSGAGTSRQAQEYIDAAKAAWKLNDAQMAVVEQIVKTAEAEGFDPGFLLSIAKAESSFNALAKATTTTASGAFQFLKGTAKQYGVRDPFNVEQATVGAAKYLTVLQRQFKDTHLAAQAYHDGEGAVARAGNRVPGDSTDPGYGTRILKNMEKLQKAMGNATDEIGKEVAKAQKDQFDTYAEGLARREKAYDDYAKIALAKNKTLTDQLQSQQQAANVAAEQAMKRGDSGALAQAEEEMRRIIIARNQATQESIAIEEKAVQKRLGNIGREIAAAQKLGQANEVAKLQAERGTAKAELAVIEESRKQLTIQTNDDLLANARQFAEKRLQIERELLDARSSLSQAQLQATIDDQKAQIDATLGQAQAQAALNEQQRQEATETLTGQAAIAQARENVNAKLRDALTLIQAEKQAALDKLSLDMQMLDYQEQIATWQRDHADSAADRIEAESELAKIHEQQAVNAQKYLDVINGVTVAEAKARAEAAKQGNKLDAQSVKEEQLRMNAYWDQMIQRMQQYASLWKEITGHQNDAFSEIAQALQNTLKNIDQIGTSYSKFFGEDALAQTITGFAQAQAALAGMSKVMLSLRNQYAEGSKGYKDMTNAAERMMEVQRSLQLVEAVLAVIHQLSAGDVYTAIPRALGVAAMIASMGITTGFGGGGNGTDSSQPGGSRSAGGGVFGDASAKSDSIANSLELIAANSSVDLAYSAGMYRALKNIEAAMGGVTNSIIRGVGAIAVDLYSSSPISPDITSSLLRVFDPIGASFGLTKVSERISDWGIADIPQTLADILSDGFRAMNWTQVERSVKVIGITVSKSIKDIYTDLNSDVAKQLVLTIRGMADAVKEAGKAFGISGDEFDSQMSGFVIDFGRFSTKGLKGEELKEAVQQMFSRMSDDMAAYFSGQFALGLEPFQRAGEGMFETLVRVADGINVASGLLAQAGMEAIQYQDIALKQGDVAAEIVRQSIVAFEGAFSTIGKYIDGAVGSAEELLATYQDLLSIRAMSAVVGLSFRDLTEDMILAAGGVAALRDSISYYMENFTGGSAASQMVELTDAFSKLGYSVPESKEAFRALVDSIDQTTPAGQRLWAQIVKLAPAFDAAAEAAKELEEMYNRLKGGTPFADANAGWEKLWDDWATVIEGKLQQIQAPFDAQINEAINQQKADIRVWATAISEATSAIGIINAEIARLGTIGAPAQGAIASLGMLVQSLYKDISAWKEKIAAARAEITRLEGETNPEYEIRRQELLKEQGMSLIRNLMQMWSQMIDGINNMTNALQDQIDSLSIDPTGAALSTANSRLAQSYAAYDAYKQSGGNDVTTELGYLSAIQSAVMARYNAELAKIQEAEAEYIAAETERLNAALQAQIEAINAATDAAIQAESDRLDAAIKAQSKLDEAAQKALRKQFDAEQKALQKAHDAQLEALQDELDAANKLKDAIKGIAEYARGMALGGNSPLSPEQRLAEAQRQYQDLLARAQGGDAEAIAKLSGASDAYLEAAKQYYGSGTQYSDTFDAVKNAMSAIGGMSAPDPDSIQSRIDALREAQAEEMDALRELQSEQLDLLREQQQERIDQMREASRDVQDGIRKAAQAQIEALQKQTQQAIADLSDPSKNAAIRELKDRTIEELKALQEQADKLREEANKQAAAWEQEVRDWMAEQNLNDQAMIDALNAIHGAITGVPEKAVGGTAGPGLTLVGEKGPELVNFTRPGMVYTAEQTQGMLSGGDDQKIVAAIAELKAEMRAVVVTQSNANPQIIEKLGGMEARLSKMERTQRFTVGA